MMGTTFAEAAHDICAGQMCHEDFARVTDTWVRQRAIFLLRRLGSTPAWLGREDVEQELRIQLWRYSLRYDATRAKRAKPETYLSFAARKAAMKMIQRAQGLEQHRRSGPARFELVGEDTQELTNNDADTPMHDAIRREQYRVLRGLCNDAAERFVIDALSRSDGTMESALSVIWENRDARLVHRLGSREQVLKLVRRTVRRFIDDYEMEAQ